MKLLRDPGNDNEGKEPELFASQSVSTKLKSLQLKISFDRANYSFWYSTSGNKWVLLKDKVDGRFLSTATARGFVGTVLGLYATSSGKESLGKVYFDRFAYKGDDDVYKQ